jgi:hypothetical protein
MPEAFRDIGIATIGWHCLLCGETVDDVILRNRARPLQTSTTDEETTDWHASEDECEVGVVERDCLESVFGPSLS